MKKINIASIFFPIVMLIAFSGILIFNGGMTSAYTLKQGGYWRNTETGTVSVMGGKFTMPINKTFFVCQNNKNTPPYAPPAKANCKLNEHPAGGNTIVYSMTCNYHKGVMKSKGLTRILSPLRYVSKNKIVFTGATGISEISNITITGYRIGETCK